MRRRRPGFGSREVAGRASMSRCRRTRGRGWSRSRPLSDLRIRCAARPWLGCEMCCRTARPWTRPRSTASTTSAAPPQSSPLWSLIECRRSVPIWRCRHPRSLGGRRRRPSRPHGRESLSPRAVLLPLPPCPRPSVVCSMSSSMSFLGDWLHLCEALHDRVLALRHGRKCRSVRPDSAGR